MRAHQRARALAVHVEVANVEFFLGPLYFFGILRVDRARQAEFAVVGERQRFVEVFGLGDGENGAEDLFAENPRLWSDIRDHGWFDEVTLAFRLRAARHQTAFLLPGIDIAEDRF